MNKEWNDVVYTCSNQRLFCSEHCVQAWLASTGQAQALLRRLDAVLPRIDRLTDAYNAVSIANLVPVGGEDLDWYQGPARLARGRWG
jgi:hypothetical protein